jgi:transposase
MNEDTLFSVPPANAPPREADCGQPRVQRPNRSQLELRPVDLDGLLPADHRARAVWDFVDALNLAPLYEQIKAVDGHAGRPAIDPAILMALWLYATLEGVGSARAVARLCEAHDAYRWLAGGVSVNYHTLADFRVGHGPVLDSLLTTSVVALVAEGLVTLTRVAHDGVKVRASAGGGSFRRGERLAQLLAEATAQVEHLRREVEDDPGATERRQTAARQRAATERQQRVANALKQLPELAARRQKAGVKGPARTSTTDPDARVMKMADAGYRPAFNAQVTTATDSQVIVGVDVVMAGTDLGQLGPMVEQVQRRYGQPPSEILADGGYVALRDIRDLTRRGCVIYAPPGRRQGVGRARDQRRRHDEATQAWRDRMATPEAQAIYRQRAASSECVNAAARNRGLQRFLVRGQNKVRTILLWFALAHNLLRTVALRQVRLATA